MTSAPSAPGLTSTYGAPPALGEKKVPLPIFTYVFGWFGDLKMDDPSPVRTQKYNDLREMVCGEWFLGFTSKTYSMANLENFSQDAKATGLFYARVSTQNPRIVSVDLWWRGKPVRVRISPPFDRQGFSFAKDFPDPQQLDLFKLESAPTVPALIRELKKKTPFTVGPQPLRLSAKDQWAREANNNNEYVGTGTNKEVEIRQLVADLGVALEAINLKFLLLVISCQHTHTQTLAVQMSQESRVVFYYLST